MSFAVFHRFSQNARCRLKNVFVKKKNKESFLLLSTLLKVCEGLEVWKKGRGMPWGVKIAEVRAVKCKDTEFKSSSGVKPAFNLFDFGSNQLLWQNRYMDRFPMAFKTDMTKYCYRLQVAWFGLFITSLFILCYWANSTNLLIVCGPRIDQQTCYNSVGLSWECF